MQKQLKKWLKKVRLNEPTISTVLGGLVILVVVVLIFNYFRAGKMGQISVQQPEESSTEAETQAVPATHKVEAGEDLWKISEKYYNDGYQWSKIAQENNLTNPDYLEVGQELKLPKIAVEPKLEVKEAEAAPAQPTVPGAIEGNKYTVQTGDNLWNISVRAYSDGYKWTEVAKANNLANPDLIDAGQELTLPR
jgi:nucleoid-associated protein YgaU